jgi:hypothetical protein
MKHFFLALSMIALAIFTFLANILPSPQASDLIIYQDALSSGWENWSWDTTVTFSNTTPVHSGSASIAITYTNGWGGFYLAYPQALAGYDYISIHFWIHGGTQGGQRIRFSLNDGGETYPFTLTNGWQEITIPLSASGSPSQIDSLVWQNDTNHTQVTFYLDDISLIGNSISPTPTTGPALSVNAAANRHPISANIYGMNFPDADLAAELHLPVARWGGNSTTRYNWQLDISNQAMDWYFENYQENAEHTRLDQFIEQNLATNTQSIITLPLIGWMPNDLPNACGFSISKYGAQEDNDWQWRPDCGNGILTNGNPVVGNDPLDTSIAIGPAQVADEVQHLMNTHGHIAFYNLDNEPMLWNDTHRDVHPAATSYDELLNRTIAYATAIKQTDPSALTLGPVTWGWTAYFWSAADWAAGDNWWLNPPDRTAHGGTPFTEWYLQQLKAYQDQNSIRLLDYLDLHYYPQANGVALSPAGNAATQALRLRSTRSLWDSTYADESWIGSSAEGPYVRLIPRMKEWVNNNYPGTKLAITEYNWGALDHINGALAQADVLGIFGREGLDLATLWSPPEIDQPGAYAFRVYRNYDGLGGHFGEISVQANSTNQDQLAIYAAQRNADNALTLIVINKTNQALSSTLTLQNFTPSAHAHVYRYSSTDLHHIQRQADISVSPQGFTTTYPANSITLLILPANGTAFFNRLFIPTIIH